MSSSHRKTSPLASLDMYRKVPIDLLEGSKEGSITSWIAIIVMATLFILETKAFLTPTLVKELSLDSSSKNEKLQVNFNITMMDLSCQYATLNVMSVFSGREYAQHNITQHVQKYAVDENQVLQQYRHRNLDQNDIAMHDESVTESVKDMHKRKQRQDTWDVDPEELQEWVQEKPYVFVDLYASWCSHCRVLMPTWERLAEVMYDAAHHITMSQGKNYTEEEYDSALDIHLPVLIAKLDCVEYHDYCQQQGIRAYPTLRLYVYGKHESDYHGDRTIVAMTQFLKLAEERHATEDENLVLHHADAILEKDFGVSEDDVKVERRNAQQQHILSQWASRNDHPGCILTGFLELDRAPGHFYIQAQSKNVELSPQMTNVSHVINHLSFGQDEYMRYIYKFKRRHADLQKMTEPLDKNVYVTDRLHQAHHHYIKLVSTNLGGYQVVPSTQLAAYEENAVPEAKFIIDLSPIRVTYRESSRRWYDYITSIMAIIGGTFTVVGMFEAGLRRAGDYRRAHAHSRPHQHRY